MHRYVYSGLLQNKFSKNPNLNESDCLEIDMEISNFINTCITNIQTLKSQYNHMKKNQQEDMKNRQLNEHYEYISVFLLEVYIYIYHVLMHIIFCVCMCI